MAYFRCSTGSASSGDGVALVVTCDANFSGSVITATNGTDTFTETCPSVSPYTVRFEGIPTGTYTISGVAQGQTFTTQFTVLDYTTSLHGVPDGATVTPVNDIQIWLHCANIWDKNYTTLDQVLADASTLQALIASNNAADYMARSTDWASDSNIGLVPVMTSNTTPSGAVSASIVQDANRDAYKAFDGNTSTYWRSTSGSASTQFWLDYKFPTATKVSKFYFTGDASVEGLSQGNYTVTLQKSTNNGSSYSNIYTSGTINLKTFEYTDPNPTAATNYRFLFTGGNAYHSGQNIYMALVQEAQFYPKAGIPNNQNAMTYIGANDYCANKLLSDTTWLNAICNSTYFESVLNVKVPTLTDNSGVICDTAEAGHGGWQAFDGNESTWYATASSLSVGFIGYTFTNSVAIKKAKINLSNQTGQTITYSVVIKGSNNNSQWSPLSSSQSIILTGSASGIVNINMSNTQAYKYYKAEITQNPVAGKIRTITVQFYGRA